MGPPPMRILEWSVIERVLPGEKESGDRYILQTTPRGVLVAVVDGIGHGVDAARTADIAIRELQDSAGESLITAVRNCHAKLRGTRGAVISLAYFDEPDNTMTWLSIGNVEGVLLRKDVQMVPAQEMLLLRGGVVGDNIPRLSASILPIYPGDLLLFATDGIRSSFANNLNTNSTTQLIAENIIERHWKKTDDALVLVARYIQDAQPAN